MSGPTTVVAPRESSSQKLSALGFFLAGFFVVWTLWALLLVRYPDLNQGGALRAIVRVTVWIVPVCLFVRLLEGPPVLERLGLTANRRQGVLFGGVGALALTAVAVVQNHSRLSHLALPTDPGTWLNAIISAPIAEELLFRSLVFRMLLERLTLWAALVVSALLFALVHLPYWWLSGADSPATLVVRLGSIFAYGVFFALLYRWSGSLLAPMISHVLNNLVTSSIGI